MGMEFAPARTLLSSANFTTRLLLGQGDEGEAELFEPENGIMMSVETGNALEDHQMVLVSEVSYHAIIAEPDTAL